MVVVTLADYYRAHREEMELALATGCTPIEARAELRRRAKARREACGTRAPDSEQTEKRAAPSDASPPPDFARWDAQWMQRD